MKRVMREVLPTEKVMVLVLGDLRWQVVETCGDRGRT